MNTKKFDKDELFAMAKRAIEENNSYFVSDIIGYLPLNKDTFYSYFPVGSIELSELKAMLNQNRIKTKVHIREKLLASQKAGELLALYRLICTPEERKYLNLQYIENTVKSDQPIVLDVRLDGVEVRTGKTAPETEDDYEAEIE